HRRARRTDERHHRRGRPRRRRHAGDVEDGLARDPESAACAAPRGRVREGAMHTFAYHRPATVRQAAALLAKKDTRPLAGGHTLLPALKLRLASVGNVVDLGGIKGLGDIAVKGKNVVIGAMARHAQVETSSAVKKAIPALAK